MRTKFDRSTRIAPRQDLVKMKIKVWEEKEFGSFREELRGAGTLLPQTYRIPILLVSDRSQVISMMRLGTSCFHFQQNEKWKR